MSKYCKFDKFRNLNPKYRDFIRSGLQTSLSKIKSSKFNFKFLKNKEPKFQMPRFYKIIQIP